MEDIFISIENYEKAISEIYVKKNLKCLRGLDHSYKLNGENILVWYYDVTDKGRKKFGSEYFNELLDDLFFISDEVIYFLAGMYLHKPYLNSPLIDSVRFYERMVYANRQNIHSKRYCAFYDVAIEKLYNYWDRLGDLLATYFKEDFKKGEKIFFSNTIRFIPQKNPKFRSNQSLTGFL